MNAINLQDAKPGDKVRLRNGSIYRIEANDGSNQPVCISGLWYKPDGSINYTKQDGEHEADVVELLAGQGTKALPLEAGSYYRTEDGRKALIGWKRDDGKWEGIVVNYGREIWDDVGVPTHGSKVTTLVAEWVEPKRIKGWVNVYSGTFIDGDACNDSGVQAAHTRYSIHDSRELADGNVSSSFTRIACIEIDVLEGAGLGEAA